MAKRAVVAVHGIGQHQPYEMARALADGLVRIAAERGVSATVEEIVPTPQSGGETPPGRVYRVMTSTAPDAFVDVYEAYWAPLTAGLTSFLSLIWWLFVNTFIPSRIMRRPHRKTFFDVGVSIIALAVIGAAYYWLFGALLQTTHVVVPTLGASAVYAPHVSFDLGRGISGTKRSLEVLSGSWTAPSHLPLGTLSLGSLGQLLAPVTLVWLLATAAGVYALFQFIYRVGDLLSDLSAFRRRAPANLIMLTASAGTYLLALGSVTPEFFTYGYVYVAYRLVNLWVKTYFVDYIGDIEVYVSRDSKNARFTARAQIQSRAVDAIRAALMSREDYAEVLVLGHSLGSVVGLDALREVRRQAGTALTFDQFRRLSAFVTFGSPLEKTRFFFDRISPDDGNRWVEFLREIQQTFLTLMPVPAVFASAAPPPLPSQHRILWFNYWYFADVVANSLESYNDDRIPDLVRVSRLPHPGMKPWVHSAYFDDDDFLRPVYALLF